MRTIAEKYIDQGIEIGEARIIRMMLKTGSFIEVISKMTGLPVMKYVA